MNIYLSLNVWLNKVVRDQYPLNEFIILSQLGFGEGFGAVCQPEYYPPLPFLDCAVHKKVMDMYLSVSMG